MERTVFVTCLQAVFYQQRALYKHVSLHKSARSYDLVFVTNVENPPGIFVAPADTFNFTLIPSFDDHEHVLRPVAIDYDPVDGMVYWTDVQHRSISRAFVDGTGSVVLLRDLIQPEGLTLDVENRVMYWTDAGSLLIERASLDGQDRSVLLNLTSSSLSDEVKPRPIVVDVTNGYLFWADWGSSPKIERANTNGASRMVLVDTGLLYPTGLALDEQGGRLYWCDAGLNIVESIDFLGQNRILRADFSGFLLTPLGLALYQGNLYWTDYYYQIANLTLGSPPSIAVISFNNFSYPFGIHIHSDTFLDHSCVDSMPCGEGERCRQFHNSYQCVCKNGLAGNNCQLANPCGGAVCSNGGSCLLSSSTDNAYFCQCPERYFGTNCELFDDPCISNPCWNGGICINATAEFACICPPDFIGSFCESQSHPYDLVFVANLQPPGIYVAPTDTFNFTLIPGLDGSHDNISRPIAIDYDPEERMVYWTDVTLSTLNRAFLDGSGVEVLFTDLQTPDGLALDVENRVMYWTDTGSDLIERATLDGRERSVVLNLTNSSLTAVEPRGIVVDPANSHLYWTDWGTAPKIERSATDGSGRRVLIDTSLWLPNGISLDLEGGRMYWCDAGFDRIEYSDLLGQGRTVLVDLTSLGIHPFDLFGYYDFIYWSDWVSLSILRVEASGRHVGTHGSESFGRAGGIHIFKANICQQMVCQHGGHCQLNAPHYTCYCAQGYSGRNCENDNLPPFFTTGCPSNILRLADNNQRSVPVSWPDLRASDPSTPLLWSSTHRPGDIFSVGGVTMVTYTVTDQAGNAASCNFTVTVTAVDLVCPANFTVDAKPGSTSTGVNWMEPVVTGWDGPTNFTSSLSPGVELQIGSHVVNYRQRFEYGLNLNCLFSVQVIGFCPASTTNDALHGRLMWLATRRGITAESFERCPLMTSKAGDPLAVRNCSVLAPPDYFQWGNHVPQSCGEERNEVTLEDATDIDVSPGNVNEVVEFLANQTSESTESAEDVEAVSTILMNIVGAGSGDTEVTELVIQTVSNVIMSTSQTPDSQTPEVNAGSSSAIVQSVEAQVALTLRQDGPVSIQQDTIHVEAVSLDPMQVTNGLTFVSAPKQQTGQSSPQEGSLVGTKVTTVVNASEVPQDVIASIRLPANIVDLIQAGNANGSQPLRASFIVYADDTLFKSALIKGSPGKNGSSLRVAGSVVSLTVEDVELVNLTEPVVIQFKAPAINETEQNRTIKCVFWDFDLNDRVGDWSTAGCLLARETNDTVSCNCSHATNFAILVNVHGQKETSKVFRDVLNIITNVGCAISIIALVITLTVYLAVKKLRTGKSRQIFIHLFFAWLILYIVFLAGVDNAKGTGGGCVFVAALLHYFVLCTLMWTAVEARNMYVSAVKVFPEDTPHYMLKACLIAWGSPLIVLTITLAAATDHYRNEDYCFLEPDLVLFLGLLAPIGLILIHNILTFILVMRSILKVKEESRSQQISKRLQNAVGISTLMGLTWSFGFLVVIDGSQAFQLIFCLANSFQGLIVFIMFCVRREEVRTALAPYMKRLCCGRTCDIQVPWKKDRSYDLPILSESVPSSQSTAHTAEVDMSVSGPY
ncbi:uncharacterized protein LOC119730971 isoform X2 [Patiria miniata]|uniref:Uncharacterized protein n=1 Tax=Patiria miniata TaxID=46514 RepID=A0A914A830_PATMI|nr:uncharacterized protein LOC119730971 isoform X2 [Patiria miniata]